MRYMKPMKNRMRLGLGVAKKIRSRIEYLATIHNCSMNFVSNTLLARQLDIDIGEAFDEHPSTTGKLTPEATIDRLGNSRNRVSASKRTH
ncbi:MAG: hypothetical protein ABWY25_06970 [Paenisporosarcina sp.]